MEVWVIFSIVSFSFCLALGRRKICAQCPYFERTRTQRPRSKVGEGRTVGKQRVGRQTESPVGPGEVGSRATSGGAGTTFVRQTLNFSSLIPRKSNERLVHAKFLMIYRNQTEEELPKKLSYLQEPMPRGWPDPVISLVSLGLYLHFRSLRNWR